MPTSAKNDVAINASYLRNAGKPFNTEVERMGK